MVRALRPTTLPFPDEAGPSEPQQAGGLQGSLHPPSPQKGEVLHALLRSLMEETVLNADGEWSGERPTVARYENYTILYNSAFP